MKMYRTVHKQIFHFTIALIFIIGLSFPSSVSFSQEEVDDVGHSGGFIVKSKKIEGVMDAFEIMQGNVDIPEGQITGLTITKKLTETEHGTLVINIKSKGPVPLDDLRAKAIGLPFFASLCESEREEWLCMEGVEMTLSEQSVNSIDLPNATVETCYEGQCADDEEEDAEAMSLMLDESKSIEEIEHDLNSVNEILQVVEERLEDAEETHETITDEEQASQVEEALESLDNHESDEDELVENANDIQETYSTFNEQASELALTTAVVDDILKQVTLVIEQDAEEITRLEDELNEANESISNQKQSKQTQEVIAENEKMAERLSDVEEMMAELEEVIAKQQRTLAPLETSSTTFLDQLTHFYEAIHATSENMGKFELESDEHLKYIRQALDVAEPAKELEKQLNDMKQEMNETELPVQTEEHEQQIEEANEQATSSVLTVSMAKLIGQLDEQIEEEIDEKSGSWEEQSEQLSRLDRKLEDVVGLAQLPETLFLERELPVLLENKHEHRAEMFSNIQHWQELLSLLKERYEDIEEALQQHGDNQNALAELVNTLMTFDQRYTAAELSTLAHYLNMGTQLQQAQEVAELIENGQHVMQSIVPVIEKADSHLENVEALSSNLVNKTLMVNTLNEENFRTFSEELVALEADIDRLERPVKQLNNHLAIAEDILGSRVSEYGELVQMYTTSEEVAHILDRIEYLIDDLDSLPYFGKIKDVISDMEVMQRQLESMVQ